MALWGVWVIKNKTSIGPFVPISNNEYLDLAFQ